MMTRMRSRLAFLVALTLGSAGGVGVMLHLRTVGAQAMVAYSNAEFGISLTVPASWHATEGSFDIQWTAPDGPKLYLVRSDRLAAANAHNGCCRGVVMDATKTRVVSDSGVLPPPSAPTVTPLNMRDYAAGLVTRMAAAGGASFLGTRSVGGEEGALVAGLPDNGILNVTLFVKHRAVLFTISALGGTHLSADQDAAIASLSFVDSFLPTKSN